MPGLPIVFFILAAVAIATAIGMLLSRSAIYSALFLVLNFATVAVLYLILGAPFIALSQITVYAGSIMVLFLFVIMLLGAEQLPRSENLRWQPLVAIPLLLVLVGDFVLNAFGRAGALPVAAAPADYGAPHLIGETLFSQYILPFEITAVILMISVVGAIILAKPDRPTMAQTLRKTVAANAPVGTPYSATEQPPAVEQEDALKEKAH